MAGLAQPRAGPAPGWRSVPAGSAGLRAASHFPTVALVLMAAAWAPSAVSLGDFSIMFVMPLLLAAWAMTRAAPRRALGLALAGSRGYGLWIEAACIGLAILFALLSLTVSPTPERVPRVLLPMAYGACVIYALSRFPPPLARRLVAAMTLAGVAIVAVAVVMSWIAPLRGLVMKDYRLAGFFENANQLSLAITTAWPLLLTMTLDARRGAARGLMLLCLAVMGYALLLSGTKTGLALCFATTCILLAYRASRTGSIDSSFVSFVLVAAVAVLSIPLLLALLAWVSPVAYEKLNEVLVGGVGDYETIRSRNLLWTESIRLGLANPLIGVGAGSHVFGPPDHSHNMILEYFRGMGVFGLLAAAVLLVATAARGFHFMATTIGRGREERARDTAILALFLGAIGYLIGNQLSDSFSPSTAFLFWAVHVCATLSTQPPLRRAEPRVERPRRWTPRRDARTA